MSNALLIFTIYCSLLEVSYCVVLASKVRYPLKAGFHCSAFGREGRALSSSACAARKLLDERRSRAVIWQLTMCSAICELSHSECHRFLITVLSLSLSLALSLSHSH